MGTVGPVDAQGYVVDQQGFIYDTGVRERFAAPLGTLSNDGSIAVGAGFEEYPDWDTVYAVRVSSVQGGLERLSPIEPGLPTMVYDVSGDGNVSVGFAADASGAARAARWTEDGAVHLLEELEGTVSSRALSVNADGTVIVGTLHFDANLEEMAAVRWTSAGVERSSAASASALHVSADGRRVVVQLAAPDNRAGLWEDGEVRWITSVLSPEDFGRPSSASLAYDWGIWGITPDGQSLFGINAIGDVQQPFVVRWPE